MILPLRVSSQILLLTRPSCRQRARGEGGATVFTADSVADAFGVDESEFLIGLPGYLGSMALTEFGRVDAVLRSARLPLISFLFGSLLSSVLLFLFLHRNTFVPLTVFLLDPPFFSPPPVFNSPL